MMSPLLRSPLLALVLTACAAPAFACSCARRPDAPLPPFVVEAQVLSVTSANGAVTATLRVRQVIKGAVGRRVTVRTNASSAACGVSFRTGEIRRIGFGGRDGAYSANLCQQLWLPPRR